MLVEPGDLGIRDRAGCEAAHHGVVEVVRLPALLGDAGGVEVTLRDRCRGDARSDQRQVPARLDRLARIQRLHQVVPRDRRRDHVDALVASRGYELDAAAIASARHAHARVARLVELRLGLLGDEVDQRRDVLGLELRMIDHHDALGCAEPAGVPRDDVVAVGDERCGSAVGSCARAGPAVADQDRGGLVAFLKASRGIEVRGDARAVERLDCGVERKRGSGRGCEQRTGNDTCDEPPSHARGRLPAHNAQRAASPGRETHYSKISTAFPKPGSQ